MSARLNNRLGMLEKAMKPRSGIADAIRKVYHDMVAGITGKPVTGGKITTAILADRVKER